VTAVCLCPTPIDNLFVLAVITPTVPRRKRATLKGVGRKFFKGDQRKKDRKLAKIPENATI